MHLNGIFLKEDFLKTVAGKVIRITRYVQPNDTMTINKFQRSRLTIDLLTNVTRIGIPPIY